MGISCERTRTFYFPMPKVACTSLKKLFWQLNTGTPFPSRPGIYRRVLRKFRFQIEIPKIQCEEGYETTEFDPRFVAPEGYESLVIVRDPISRLRSAWSSKVNEQVFRLHGEVAIIKAAGLSVSPSFAEFIDHFDIYRSLSHPVRRHTESYSLYLGRDLDRFDRVFRLEEMRELESYFSQRAGQSIIVPNENRSSRNVRDCRLNRESIDLLKEITHSEYELVSRYYSFEAGIEAYLHDDQDRHRRRVNVAGIRAGNESPI